MARLTIAKTAWSIAYGLGRDRADAPLVRPFLDRTVRRFTCLPIGVLLASVGVVSWHGCASRGDMPICGAVGWGTTPPPQPRRQAEQALPQPWSRGHVSRMRETGTGAGASCFLEGLRRSASRSRAREPGACGHPEIRDDRALDQPEGHGLIAGEAGDEVGRLGSSEATAVTGCTRFGGGALAGWRELADRIGCDGAMRYRSG
jgi:hypothetical protein